MSAPVQQVTPERLMQFAWGYAAPLMIEAALEHGVFDLVDQKAMTAAELSAATGASERGLRILNNALAGFGLLQRDSEGRYTTTSESSTFLVHTKPTYQGGLFRHVSIDLLPKWSQLSKIVHTGEPVQRANEETSAKFFEQFVTDIFPMSYGAARALAEHLGVANATSDVSVLDIGAGSGVWGIALAQASPRVKINAVDWASVLEITRKVATKFGVAERLHEIPGSYRDVDFGSGHQIATIGHILHGEGERGSKELLKKVGAAVTPGGTVAIAEFLVNDERTGPPNGLVFAVNMLVNAPEGDTFSFNEIAGWLTEAGFVNPRTLDAPGPSPLILATKG